jgi:outer membrane protein assembly factor BamE
MRKLLTSLATLFIFLLLVACTSTETLEEKMLNAADNLPGIHKINVQQGNIVTQEMVDQLRPGMTRRQVKFLLGTPLLADPFHADRWDYFYTLNTAGKHTKDERLTVVFDGDKLASLKGNFKPSNNANTMTINTQVIDVPKREEKEIGFFEKALRAIGLEHEKKI